MPKDWARSRYNLLFDCINATVCDLHIIGGDIFDKVPTLEELELFLSFVQRTSHDTLVFSGNHEATKRNQTFFTHLVDLVSQVNKKTKIVVAPTANHIFSILPYEYLHRKGEIEKLPQDLLLFTHVRGEIAPHVKPEVDLERLKNFPIVFAGDLHSYENSQRNIVYPGTPIGINFTSKRLKYGGLLIDSDTNTYERRLWGLPQLIRKTIKSEKDALPSGEGDHIIYKLEGSLEDLKDVNDNELIVEKVLKREETPAIDLENMTLAEELMEYLKNVLQIQDISSIMKVYNDNINKLELE